MATFAELQTILTSSELRNKVAVAGLIVADAVINEDEATLNHANRIIFAKRVLTNPTSHAIPLTHAVVASNSTATLSQITGAADSLIKTNVEAVWNTFSDGTVDP